MIRLALVAVYKETRDIGMVEKLFFDVISQNSVGPTPLLDMSDVYYLAERPAMAEKCLLAALHMNLAAFEDQIMGKQRNSNIEQVLNRIPSSVNNPFPKKSGLFLASKPEVIIKYGHILLDFEPTALQRIPDLRSMKEVYTHELLIQNPDIIKRNANLDNNKINNFNQQHYLKFGTEMFKESIKWNYLSGTYNVFDLYFK